MNKHGGYYGEKKREVIDFSVNINPLGVSTKVVEKIQEGLEGIDRYPEIDGISGRSILAKHIGVDEDEVILGNGAIELIYLFANVVKPKKVMIIQPTFNEYERALRTVDSEIVHFINKSENNFKIHIDDLILNLKKTKPDLLVLCNPNNPTGGFIEVEKFYPVLEVLKEMGVYLFLDESFIDFSERDSFEGLINEYPVFIIRSMTKFHAIPGLRLGYGIGSKDIIEKLNKSKAPWAVNSLALGVVPVILEDQDYINQTMKWYKEEKKYLWGNLNQIRRLRVYPSKTNFFLLKLKNITAMDLKEKLLNRNIYIRDCLDFHGLDDTYIRVAVKKHLENEVLVKELKSILEN